MQFWWAAVHTVNSWQPLFIFPLLLMKCPLIFCSNSKVVEPGRAGIITYNKEVLYSILFLCNFFFILVQRRLEWALYTSETRSDSLEWWLFSATVSDWKNVAILFLYTIIDLSSLLNHDVPNLLQLLFNWRDTSFSWVLYYNGESRPIPSRSVQISSGFVRWLVQWIVPVLGADWSIKHSSRPAKCNMVRTLNRMPIQLASIWGC